MADVATIDFGFDGLTTAKAKKDDDVLSVTGLASEKDVAKHSRTNLKKPEAVKFELITDYVKTLADEAKATGSIGISTEADTAESIFDQANKVKFGEDAVEKWERIISMVKGEYGRASNFRASYLLKDPNGINLFKTLISFTQTRAVDGDEEAFGKIQERAKSLVSMVLKDCKKGREGSEVFSSLPNIIEFLSAEDDKKSLQAAFSLLQSHGVQNFANVKKGFLAKLASTFGNSAVGNAVAEAVKLKMDSLTMKPASSNPKVLDLIKDGAMEAEYRDILEKSFSQVKQEVLDVIDKLPSTISDTHKQQIRDRLNIYESIYTSLDETEQAKAIKELSENVSQFEARQDELKSLIDLAAGISKDLRNIIAKGKGDVISIPPELLDDNTKLIFVEQEYKKAKEIQANPRSKALKTDKEYESLAVNQATDGLTKATDTKVFAGRTLTKTQIEDILAGKPGSNLPAAPGTSTISYQAIADRYRTSIAEPAEQLRWDHATDKAEQIQIELNKATKNAAGNYEIGLPSFDNSIAPAYKYTVTVTEDERNALINQGDIKQPTAQIPYGVLPEVTRDTLVKDEAAKLKAADQKQTEALSKQADDIIKAYDACSGITANKLKLVDQGGVLADRSFEYRYDPSDSTTAKALSDFISNQRQVLVLEHRSLKSAVSKLNSTVLKTVTKTATSISTKIANTLLAQGISLEDGKINGDFVGNFIAPIVQKEILAEERRLEKECGDGIEISYKEALYDTYRKILANNTNASYSELLKVFVDQQSLNAFISKTDAPHYSLLTTKQRTLLAEDLSGLGSLEKIEKEVEKADLLWNYINQLSKNASRLGLDTAIQGKIKALSLTDVSYKAYRNLLTTSTSHYTKKLKDIEKKQEALRLIKESKDDISLLPNSEEANGLKDRVYSKASSIIQKILFALGIAKDDAGLARIAKKVREANADANDGDEKIVKDIFTAALETVETIGNNNVVPVDFKKAGEQQDLAKAA